MGLTKCLKSPKSKRNSGNRDNMRDQHEKSVLFITLDSCRYDTFIEANIPNMRNVGQVYKAKAPGNFTYSSHAAMFMGFTPGIAEKQEPFVNPKYGKIFKLVGAGFGGSGREHILLEGKNIIDGFKRKHYLSIGSGAVGWFNPQSYTGKQLSQDFDEFYHPGGKHRLRKQMDWIESFLDDTDRLLFVFLNIGETHVPYYYEGAPWDRNYNPCIPFSKENNAKECRQRQLLCLEHVDRMIAPLLAAFRLGTTVICSDHGDCWGEDGLWEHGIHHEKVYDVPLVFRLNGNRFAGQ